MSRSILKTTFNEASMIAKLKKSAGKMNESQQQAVKRWGVSTCRVLAVRTQAFGKSAVTQKKAMFSDGLKVIFIHEGRAEPSRTGRSMTYVSKFGKSGVSIDKYLTSVDSIIKWIDTHRTGRNRRTKLLPPEERAVCSVTLFKKAINQKHKRTSGMAKDGWLDAGDQISKGQKGHNPIKIGAGFIKWSRKPAKLGSAKESKRVFRSIAKLTHKLGYVSNSYVLKEADKTKAIQDGLKNTIKWYKKSIKAINKKKK